MENKIFFGMGKCNHKINVCAPLLILFSVVNIIHMGERGSGQEGVKCTWGSHILGTAIDICIHIFLIDSGKV